MDGFARYGSIEYRMDMEELPATLKVAGVSSDGHPNFSNIELYHTKYKPIMAQGFQPYTEIGLSENLGGRWDYVFGCRVDSLEDLPEGMIGLDTGFSRFASITFRSATAFELVGGADGPGSGMRVAGEYIRNEWLPKNLDQVADVNAEHMLFRAPTGEERWLGMIEVYKVDIQNQPEMCFYIPLKG